MTMRRAAMTAALVNGAIVLVVPLALLAWLDRPLTPSNTFAVAYPPGVTFASVETRRLMRVAVVLLPFVGLAVWRTWVYARRVLARESSGWRAVGEAVVCGVGVLVLMASFAVPSMLSRGWPNAGEILQLVMIAGIAAFIGLIVGVTLRFSALTALRLLPRPSDAGTA